MTSSRRSTVAALVLFVLIAAAMLGSMAWATAASFQLAKQNVEDEHTTRVEGALRRIESHILGIINSEAARDFNEYLDHHAAKPDLVILDGRRQLNPQYVEVMIPSPLAKADPPFHWMDLHFQVTPQGDLGSPQIPDMTLWGSETADFSPDFAQRSRQTWAWMERVYTGLDFRQRIAEAYRLERQASIADEDNLFLLQELTDRASSASDTSRVALTANRRSLSTAQRPYSPQSECLHPEIVAQNIQGLDSRKDGAEEDEDASAESISLDPNVFAPAFWLDPGVVGPRKLAFVREYVVNGEIYYQGVVGDWARLRDDLLQDIREAFPEADLEPVANGAVLDPETSRLKVSYIPAVLRVAGIPGGADAVAWASIGWQITTSWAAAAAVLVIAGLGVRNLVALTERRMQFAYAVTHELRTPLTTFRLYSDMLSAGLVPESAKQEYLDTLNRESMRLSRLVEEVLEYARLENQKARLHVTQTDAPGLLSVVGETLDKLCRHNGVDGKTVNAIPNGKPIRTDVNVVNQITGVLVNNACRHARSSANPMVVVELGGDNGRVHLDVIDTGPGIDRTDTRHIFKPFRRGKDADRTARGGIGLGLALARNWARLLGGRLDLVSRHHPKYKGAHFRLTIPSDGAEAN